MLAQDKVKALLSSEHFSVDGTLLEAWASLKSFRPKDGSGEPPDPGRNGERDFHGERRRNDTHGSTTDPEARLFRKGPGKEARLCFMGHALMENRNGLIVGAVTTTASGHGERKAALALIEPHGMTPQPVTLGADKGYDSADFVMQLQDKAITPHVAQNTNGRRSAVDDRITRHPGYVISQRHPQTRRGGLRLGQDGGRPAQDAASRAAQGSDWQFTLAMAAYNLVRLPKLLAGVCPMSRHPSRAVPPARSAPNSTCRKNAPATAIPIVAGARTPQNQDFFSTLLGCHPCSGRCRSSECPSRRSICAGR